MKSKLLPILLVMLILLNGVLIFMLIKKTHKNVAQNQERTFLANQLEFTEEQQIKFIHLDELHREAMRALEEQTRRHKDLLFHSFSDGAVNIDSLSQIIGKINGEKEVEVFRFFKSVREICTVEQQEKFDTIIEKALKGGQNGPPREGMNHPPMREGMPPPPPR
jgi:hypothetical protein